MQDIVGSRIKGTILLLGIALLFSACSKNSTNANSEPNVYQRVLVSGVIRASYIPYPPYCIVDPNTGRKSGVFVEALDLAGKKLGLRVEWTQEVGWGTVFEGLNNNMYDIVGSGLWENAARGKSAYFSVPLFYNPIYVWARMGDKRFDDNLGQIESPAIKIAVQDGAVEDLIARSDFPMAGVVSITQTNPWSDNLLNIVTHKADVTFAEPSVIFSFLKQNPNSLREVKTNGPIRVFANCYAMKMGAEDFRAMINAAINELISDGSIDRILIKYEHGPEEYLRIASPYKSR